jgi:hypothetical protein
MRQWRTEPFLRLCIKAALVLVIAAFFAVDPPGLYQALGR